MVQVAKSGLMAKYGAKLDKAVKAHKDDPIVMGQQNLPGGIKNGIAQLVDCKFDVYKDDTKMKKADGSSAKGEYFFYAAGTVMEPTLNDEGVPVAGLRTSYTEPVCDTKKSDGTVITVDEHVASILNELKKLGADVDGADGSVLEAIAAERVEAAPFFRFSTTLAQPQIDPKTNKPKLNPATKKPYEPRVWENWYGIKGLEGYTAPDGSESIQDDTGTEAADETPADEVAADEPADEVPFGDNLDDLVGLANSDDTDAAAEATEKLAALAKEAGFDSDDEPDWETVAQKIREFQAGGGGEDLSALAEAAEAGDQEAADKLDELRQAAGIDDETYAGLSWTELAEAITNAGGEEAADEAPAISAGDVVGYKQINPTTKKPNAKATDCEVLSVKDDKVTLKDLTTNKTILDKMKKPLWVPMSDLITS